MHFEFANLIWFIWKRCVSKFLPDPFCQYNLLPLHQYHPFQQYRHRHHHHKHVQHHHQHFNCWPSWFCLSFCQCLNPHLTKYQQWHYCDLFCLVFCQCQAKVILSQLAARGVSILLLIFSFDILIIWILEYLSARCRNTEPDVTFKARSTRWSSYQFIFLCNLMLNWWIIQIHW